MKKLRLREIKPSPKEEVLLILYTRAFQIWVCMKILRNTVSWAPPPEFMIQ